jgi:hypothetical protein
MKHLKSAAFVAVMILLELILIGCDAAKQVSAPQPPPVVVTEPPPAKPEVPPKATPGGEAPGTVAPQRLSWENTDAPHPERRPSSEHLWKLVAADLATYARATDITTFCPKFFSISTDLEIKSIAELIVAVTYHESGYKPTSWMTETTMGTDPVTGNQVKSEGLLQLSYQDMKNFGYLAGCGIDWSKDRGLAQDDPKKTIFDPLINLTCGMRIMKDQINRKGAFTLSSGVYWAVLNIGGKYTQIPDIIKRVKKNVPACN